MIAQQHHMLVSILTHSWDQNTCYIIQLPCARGFLQGNFNWNQFFCDSVGPAFVAEQLNNWWWTLGTFDSLLAVCDTTVSLRLTQKVQYEHGSWQIHVHTHVHVLLFRWRFKHASCEAKRENFLSTWSGSVKRLFFVLTKRKFCFKRESKAIKNWSQTDPLLLCISRDILYLGYGFCINTYAHVLFFTSMFINEYGKTCN